MLAVHHSLHALAVLALMRTGSRSVASEPGKKKKKRLLANNFKKATSLHYDGVCSWRNNAVGNGRVQGWHPSNVGEAIREKRVSAAVPDPSR